MHCINVNGLFWLLPFLVAWAWSFQVGQRLWVCVAILFLASMGSAVTCGVCHSDILYLVLRLGQNPLCNVMKDCFLPSKWLGCVPNNYG